MTNLVAYQLAQKFLVDFKSLAEEYMVATRGPTSAHDLLEVLIDIGEFEANVVAIVRNDIKRMSKALNAQK